MGLESALCALLVVCVTCCMVTSVPVNLDNEKDATYWNKIAKDDLQNAIHNNKPIVGVAKNVIIFLGDGMGVTTVTAGRILAGQMKGEVGEDHKLSFERFPHIGLSKTYNVDHQTPDSAGTGTAYLCGVKTNIGIIGVDASVKKGNCSTAPDSTHLTSILDWSLAKGKSVGVVTTTRVTHATPAATYAHTPHRDWENNVPEDQRQYGCKDIASQLVEDNPDIRVIMGGGRRDFLPDNTRDVEGELFVKGRVDGRDLIKLWEDTQRNKSRNFKYVWNETEFNNVNPDNTDYLLGLFNPSHMAYEVDRAKDKAGEPHIKDMTRKAIEILRKNDEGFFLLVEGGRIDHGHHENRASKALHDTVAFAEAVGVAVNMLDEKDSLIVVTADHSHAFAFAGYPGRGNNILGLVQDSQHGLFLGTDGMPYTTMVYGNGPGHTGLSKTQLGRQNLTNVNTSDPEFRQQSIVPLNIETHGGEDVAIFARGPMAHLFHTVHEQNYIPHVMAYASCVGAYSEDKDCAKSLEDNSSSGQAGLNGYNWWRMVWLLVAILVLTM